MTSFEKWTSGEKNRQKQIVKIQFLIVCLKNERNRKSKKSPKIDDIINDNSPDEEKEDVILFADDSMKFHLED